mmetsp:Transcript_10830/g.28872  ORF Transcript_10830/g.28872 Transcript_10830/m.28872 type:complete len:286 (+) Transcript_10830:1623-2480(+)
MYASSLSRRRSNRESISLLFDESSSSRSAMNAPSMFSSSISYSSCSSLNSRRIRPRSSSISSLCCFRLLTYSSSLVLSWMLNVRIRSSFESMISLQLRFWLSISLWSSCGMFCSSSSAQRISTVAFCFPERTASSCRPLNRSCRCFSSPMRRWLSRQSASTRIMVIESMPVDFFLSRWASELAICCWPLSPCVSSAASLRLSPASGSDEVLRASTRARRMRLRSSLSGTLVLYSPSPCLSDMVGTLRSPALRRAALPASRRRLSSLPRRQQPLSCWSCWDTLPGR